VKYCPSCKAEYEDWVAKCSDCDAPLVNELPPEPQEEYIKFRELLFTYSPGDIAFIKSLFDANNIRYHMQGEAFLQLRPMAQPVGIMVDEKQYEEAKELLKDFKQRFTGAAPRDDDDNPDSK